MALKFRTTKVLLQLGLEVYGKLLNLGHSTINVELVLADGHRPDALGQTRAGGEPHVHRHIARAKGSAADRDSVK